MITTPTAPIVAKLRDPATVGAALGTGADDFSKRIGEAFAQCLEARERIADAGFLLAWELLLSDMKANRVPALAGYPRMVFAAIGMSEFVKELAAAVCDGDFAAAVASAVDERDALMAAV